MAINLIKPMDGETSFDISIGSVDNIKAQLGSAGDMEIFVSGDYVSGESMSDIFYQLGISKNTDDKGQNTLTLGKSWKENDELSAEGFTAYYNETYDTTIWVNTESGLTGIQHINGPNSLEGHHLDSRAYDNINTLYTQGDIITVHTENTSKPVQSASEMSELSEIMEEMMSGFALVDMSSEAFMSSYDMGCEDENYLDLNTNEATVASTQFENGFIFDSAEHELSISMHGGGI